MQGAIVYVDQSEVRPGKLPEVREAVRALVDLVEPREPQLLAYAFYLDEATARMTVVAVHPNAASLERHLVVGAPGFKRFEGLIELRSIDVYGTPSRNVRDQLEAKGRMLGTSARISIHEPYAGFARLPLLAAPA